MSDRKQVVTVLEGLAEALNAHDEMTVSAVRRQLHHLNHRIRAHTH